MANKKLKPPFKKLDKLTPGDNTDPKKFSFKKMVKGFKRGK